jgi:hypothetical protein
MQMKLLLLCTFLMFCGMSAFALDVTYSNPEAIDHSIMSCTETTVSTDTETFERSQCSAGNHNLMNQKIIRLSPRLSLTEVGWQTSKK